MNDYPLPPGREAEKEISYKKIRVHRFSCKNDESWILMPKVLRRIKQFCNKYDTETKSSYLIPQITQMFATDHPGLGLWGGIDEDGNMVGHILVTVEQYCGEPFLLVMQAGVDNGFPVGVTHKVFNEIERWGRKNKIKKIHISTERLPEAFQRKYKFEKYKTVMIKEIRQAEK